MQHLEDVRDEAIGTTQADKLGDPVAKQPSGLTLALIYLAEVIKEVLTECR